MHNYRGIYNAHEQYRDRMSYVTPSKKHDFYQQDEQMETPSTQFSGYKDFETPGANSQLFGDGLLGHSSPSKNFDGDKYDYYNNHLAINNTFRTPHKPASRPLV